MGYIHGQRTRKNRSKEYTAWVNMKDRCYNISHSSYQNYGGRRIAVCDRWLSSFENFLEDMGVAPTPKHSLDRFPDNNGHYEPGNCRWATTAEQNINKRSAVFIEYNGIVKSLSQWSKSLGISKNTISDRYKSGFDIAKYQRKRRKTKADSSNSVD